MPQIPAKPSSLSATSSGEYRHSVWCAIIEAFFVGVAKCGSRSLYSVLESSTIHVAVINTVTTSRSSTSVIRNVRSLYLTIHLRRINAKLGGVNSAMNCPTQGVNAIVQNAMFVGEYSTSSTPILCSRPVRLRCQSSCSGCVRPPIGSESGGFRRSLGYSVQGFCPCTATARGVDYRHRGDVIGTRHLFTSSHTF